MDAPKILSSEITATLPPGENNPRNSEGDFAKLKDGRILFAYSKYVGSSGHDDAPCNVSAIVSSDNGKSFEKVPHFLAEAKQHNTLNIMSVSLERLDNGTLCLFYLCKQGPQSEMYLRRCIDETNIVFGEPELIVPQLKNIYYVVNNCRVAKLSDGSLILPLARHRIVKRPGGRRSGIYFGNCCFYKGDPDGTNFKQVSNIVSMYMPGFSETGLQEPGVTELSDGRLLAYFRTDRHFQFESFSSDGGKNWSRPVPSRFTSPDSPMLILKNPYSGLYYSIWNPIPNYNGRLDKNKRWIHAGRTPFVLAVSENGLDFSDYTVIENNPDHGYCYPAILFLNEKEMLLSYCCGGEEDGTCLSKTAVRHITLE
ncbi:MAG: exo-alpha-sialidase [Oscillospiraceae bacterium]|nr:exo-alpha-sialidase [Oscillospiraceae bacterium]